MSREQWGHGFYSGIKKAEELEKENRPRYICEYHDGLCNSVAIIHEQHGDIYVIEYIDYITMLYHFCLFGGSPSLAKADILPDHVKECKLSDLENPKLYYSWNTVMGEFMRSEKEFDRRNKA